MASCVGTSRVTVRKSTFTRRSTKGMMRNQPGPLGDCTRPRRKTTPRSYSAIMRTDKKNRTRAPAAITQRMGIIADKKPDTSFLLFAPTASQGLRLQKPTLPGTAQAAVHTVTLIEQVRVFRMLRGLCTNAPAQCPLQFPKSLRQSPRCRRVPSPSRTAGGAGHHLYHTCGFGASHAIIPISGPNRRKVARAVQEILMIRKVVNRDRPQRQPSLGPVPADPGNLTQALNPSGYAPAGARKMSATPVKASSVPTTARQLTRSRNNT